MAFIQGRRILLQKGGSVSNYGMSGGKLCSAFAGIMVKNYKYVDGVRRADDFNYEEYYVTIYIYQLTPELEAQIRQEVKLGPHVRLRSIDEYFWED